MMFAMEEVLCELSDHEKKNEQGLPPGFRFHPTDEELITFYLASKVFNGSFGSTTNNVKFAEVDLNRCEPWELPDVAKMGEREWYLFSLRDRKYPTGLRTNRATGAGYWKATGKDKEVYSGSLLIGMKKTLVFYKGRAPRGEKTKWVMHEYRLDGHFSPINSHSHHHSHRSHTCKEEWVICRIFHKSGEKRTQLLQVQQGQQHLGASSSPKKTCLPPHLQATPTSFTALELLHESQSQQQRDFQNDKNDLSFSHLFPLHASFPQYSFPITAAATNNTQGGEGEIMSHARGRNHPSSELLFNFKSSHLSQHNNNCPTLKQTIPKTEATTTFYEIHHSLDHDDGTSNINLRWMDNSSSNDFHNSFRPLETLDSGLMPFSGAAANAEFRDMMSTSIPFNRVALEYAPVGIDSWPQPQLV